MNLLLLLLAAGAIPALARIAGVMLKLLIELIGGLSVGEEKSFYRKLDRAAETHLKKLEARTGLRKIPHSI